MRINTTKNAKGKTQQISTTKKGKREVAKNRRSPHIILTRIFQSNKT